MIGGGKDGTVFMTSRRTAVKLHANPSVYRRERDAYRRLQDKRVDRINQFKIPSLISSHDELLAIQMTTVEPPFILDFASAILDEEWTDDPALESDLEELVLRLFDDRASDVFFALERLVTLHGIHMLDARPSNIAFE